MKKIKPILVTLLFLSLYSIWYVSSVVLLRFVLDDYNELLTVVAILSILPFFLLFKYFAPSMRAFKTKLIEKNVYVSIVSGVVFYLVAKPLYMYWAPCRELTLDGTNGGILASLIGAVVIAPITEELFYRHWMVSYLDKYGYSYFAKMMVSAILFFVLHILPIRVNGVWMVQYWRIDTLFFGIIAYWVYMKTKDVRYCIIIHMAHNLCSSIIFPLIVS